MPLAILIELGGIGATMYGYLALKKNAEDADMSRFSALVDSQMAGIKARLDSYESVLYGGVGFLSGSEDVNADEWRRYVNSVPLQRMAPGILGMGTISPVSAAEREQRIAEYQKSRGEAFVYKTVDRVPPPANGSYIIERIEPLARNRNALGLDIGSEANRRTAYEAARDTGVPQITGIITLVQDDHKTPGFLLMVPRYQVGKPLDSVEQRREAFLDTVYSPMIGKDILSVVSTTSASEVAFAVYDEAEKPERLIYQTAEFVNGYDPKIEQIVTWPYAGRKWLVRTWTTDRFVSKNDGGRKTGFLIAGMIVITALAGFLLMIHRRHNEALKMMDEFHEQADERGHINDLFVKYAPAAIAIFDKNLCYLAASLRWMDAFNIKEDVVGKHHYDVFHEIQNQQRWLDIHQRCLAGGSESCDQDLFIKADGSQIFLRWEIHPWHKANGGIGGIIMFTQDITNEVESRKRLLEAQREVGIMEERLRQATTAGKVGIWDYSIHEDRLIWNDVMFKLFGGDPSNFSGNLAAFRKLVHPDDLAKVEAALRRTAEENVPYEIEYRAARSGNPTILAMGNVQCDDAGKAMRMLGVCVDISEQVRIREELANARDQHAIARSEAEKMAQAKQQFLATMSHEIRTPMNGVIGMSELLLSTKLDQEQLEFAKTITQCGQSLLALINDILDFSKIDAGELRLEKYEFDPVEVIDRVLRVVDKQIVEKGLKLECVIDDQMPHKVIGDANRLHQVLLNLLSNAVKFTMQGCVRIEARVIGLENSDAELVIIVQDEGIGMNAEALENVFVPFVQADASTTRKFGGTGLGLAISHSLTEMMGGSLDLQSELGRGTKATLRVKFPLAMPEVNAAGSNDVESDNQGSQVKTLRFERVLIVEDNPINQRVTELQMKKFTKSIDIAINGQQAVEMFGENRYDLVLMDCQMPVMDGFDATLQIRALEAQRNLPRTPILALTANVYPSDQQRVFDVGMDGFLAKPLRIDVLIAELEKFRNAAH